MIRVATGNEKFVVAGKGHVSLVNSGGGTLVQADGAVAFELEFLMEDASVRASDYRQADYRQADVAL